ncbi:MAG: FAD-dependent oxidoreductase [Ruminococcaceae bacterium]|nr:FAD-dependent oxidoreductase [Oscillospiraceae bacterium]
MNNITYNKTIPVKKKYDVIVCGGGVAGVAGAVSAAKNGFSTLLLEKSNVLGGLGTLGLINLFVPMCNGCGKQIIFGLAEKWLRLSAELGWDTIHEEWKNGEPKEPTNRRYTQRFSPAIFAYQLTDELKKSGADVLFDCIATDPIMDGNVCKGVVVESKAGTEFYPCRMLIDTTGDCDVLRRGGVPTVSGENFFTFTTKMVTLESCREAIEKNDIRFIYKVFSGGNINLFGDDQPEEMPRWSGLSAEEVTDYIVRNQLLILQKLKESDRKTREIVTTPGMPQFRTTAHIKGDYSFKVTDAYRHFDDSVCAINDFAHRYHLYEIPLRCLTRRDYPNIITAGRSADGTGFGWDLIRVIPPAILTGQAAGEAACLALRTGCAVADVDIKALQKKLEKENVMIHFPDEYVPEDRTVIIHGKNAIEIDGGHL